MTCSCGSIVQCYRSTSVGLGGSVLIFQNAEMGGDVTPAAISMSAASDEFLLNIAASVSIGGTGTALLYHLFQANHCQSSVRAEVQATGDMTIAAESKEFITADEMGIRGEQQILARLT